MKYTEKQRKAIERMIWEFGKVHDNKKRLELLEWYDFASAVHDLEATKQIMIDLKAI